MNIFKINSERLPHYELFASDRDTGTWSYLTNKFEAT